MFGFSRLFLRLGLVLGAVWLAACTPASNALGPIYLDEVLNEVQISNAGSPFERAQSGAPVAVGAKITSGGNSLAKLTFETGPAVRLSSNTTFQLEQPGAFEAARLNLEAGRLRLSLFGQWFGITTAMGLVRTNGFAEVLYLTGPTAAVADDVALIRCFSGPCSFETETLNLQAQNLEQVTIRNFGETVTREQLTALDLRQFTADNPGSASAIASATAAPALTIAAATASSTPTVTATPTPAPTLGFGVAPTATRPTPTFTVTPRPPTVAFTATPTAPFIIAPTSTQSNNNGGGGGGGGNNPTNTSVPPTNRPPPTDTPRPPTNTPVPSTNTVEPTATEAPTKTPPPTDTSEPPTDPPPTP